MDRILFYFKFSLWFLFLLFAITACQSGNNPIAGSPSPSDMETPIPENESTQEPTPMPPTNTPIPMAISVNGFEISEGELEAELALYQTASGTELATEDKQYVLDELIDQALLAHAANKNGFVLEENEFQRRIEQITMEIGGQQALQDWISTFGYHEDDFRRTLSRSIAAAWMRDQILDAVPEQAEQVHARQILFFNAEQANRIYEQLLAGYDFYNLALENDPITAGDLGWFPRDYLPFPEIEEAAFNLQNGEFSQVIETVAGYHILQLIERDPLKPLTSDALQALQKKVLQDWLEEQRTEADIIVY